MTFAPLRAALLGLALATGGVATTGFAQSDSLSQLQLELDALDTVTDSLGPMRKDAQRRVELMTSFIQQSGMEDAWKSWTGTTEGKAFHGLSFQQAYQQALQEEKSRGGPKPSVDRETLAAEVQGQRTLAEGQWNTVNALHEQVGRMTAFLQSKNAMDSYMTFARKASTEKPQERPDAGTDRRSESSGITPAQRKANIAKYRAQQEKLRRHWDHYHFTSGTGSLPPGGPFRGNPQGNPIGEDPNQVGDVDPYIGAYPNSAVENEWYSGDYWGGSWWNGYADPYYDVYGYGPRWRGDAARRAYHRAQNAHPDLHRR
ncbi:MAG: hypothetical protein VX672_08905 [Planctomycetota bacterium]|nr:hypothetical protein [Planctomycetota bacterium]